MKDAGAKGQLPICFSQAHVNVNLHFLFSGREKSFRNQADLRAVFDLVFLAVFAFLALALFVLFRVSFFRTEYPGGEPPSLPSGAR